MLDQNKPITWDKRKERSGSSWLSLNNQLLYQADSIKNFQKNIYPFTLHSTVQGVFVMNLQNKKKQNLEFNEPNFLFQRVKSQRNMELCYAGKEGQL